MFKQLERDFKNNEPEKPQLEEFNFSLYNSSIILDSLSNDKLSDGELYKVIEMNYSFILHTIYENKDVNYINKFIDARFVNMFTQVISKIQLSEIEKMYCNSLCYDFMNIPQTDEYLKSLFLTMARTVNRDLLPRLLALNIPEDVCLYLCVARNSTLDESLNVRRLNNIIIKSSLKIMSEQVIVKIYESLFNNISALFQATLLDVYSQEQLNNISNEAGEIYSIISLAVLDLLHVMPTPAILSVLRNYAQTYNTIGGYVRFSMYSISVEDYGRIVYATEQLKIQELIIVP